MEEIHRDLQWVRIAAFIEVAEELFGGGGLQPLVEVEIEGLRVVLLATAEVPSAREEEVIFERGL